MRNFIVEALKDPETEIARVERLTRIYKSVTAADKFDAEGDKICSEVKTQGKTAKAEASKFFWTQSTPVPTSVVLAATFIFQMAQFRTTSKHFRCLWPFLCLGLAAIQTAAQSPLTLSIGEAIRNRSDHRAVHLDEMLMVTGVVTDPPHDVGSGSSLANLQDATGGIALFATHAVLPPGSFKRGDILKPAASWPNIGEWKNCNSKASVDWAQPCLLLP